MKRVDFSDKLTGGTEQVPVGHWSKFNNSWLLLNRAGAIATYLVSYQACAFYVPGEEDGISRLVPRGLPGEVGSVWGYLIAKSGADEDEDEFECEYDNSDSDEDNGDVIMGEDDEIDFREIEYLRTVGLATLTVTISEDDTGIADIQTVSDQLFDELDEHLHPQLLRDDASGKIYLKIARYVKKEGFNAEALRNPCAQRLKPGYHSQLIEIDYDQVQKQCTLGKKVFVGPEVIPGQSNYECNWYNECATYFDDGSLNILPLGMKKELKTGRNLKTSDDPPFFTLLQSRSVVSNIGDLATRLQALGIDPQRCIKMHGPLLEVPRQGITPATERNVKRYLGVGRVVVPCYEPFFWIRGVLEKYCSFYGGDLHKEGSSDEVEQRIDEAFSNCRTNLRVFKKHLQAHVQEIILEGLDRHYEDGLQRWSAEHLAGSSTGRFGQEAEGLSDHDFKRVQDYILNEFSEFLIKIFLCPPGNRSVKWTSGTVPYNAVSDWGSTTNDPLNADDIVMPPGKINFIFLYDMLVGEGGENANRPDTAWHQYRFSDAFLLKDGEDLDPHAVAYNLAPTPSGYLLGYGASQRYAKVTHFTEREMENLLQRAGSPADRMQFKFI